VSIARVAWLFAFALVVLVLGQQRASGQLVTTTTIPLPTSTTSTTASTTTTSTTSTTAPASGGCVRGASADCPQFVQVVNTPGSAAGAHVVVDEFAPLPRGDLAVVLAFGGLSAGAALASCLFPRRSSRRG
jgi:hypothetical protein